MTYFDIYNEPPIFILGGAGSLGRTLAKRFRDLGRGVVVFSRDEAKHHDMSQSVTTCWFEIGDIRDYDSVLRALKKWKPKVIINAAAMKQVPTCEVHPYEALKTNAIGTHNLVRAIDEYAPPHITRVLSISTDKACKPVNAYGMTKALQERIHLNARTPNCIFNCVRYGNVLESTGSVIPVFKKRLERKQELKVTHRDMTRFLLSLDQAVDLIFTALATEFGKKIYVPKVPSAKIMDLAEIMAEPHGSSVGVSGIRPGEKIHEILVSEEELRRTQDCKDYYIIHDAYNSKQYTFLKEEYSSASNLMTKEELKMFLKKHGVI